MNLVDTITKIQNGAKSLLWGYTRHSETEYMFAVGHKSYPGEIRYLIVSEDFAVREVDGSTQVLVKKCKDEVEVIPEIVNLLKQWFPVKEVSGA